MEVAGRGELPPADPHRADAPLSGLRAGGVAAEGRVPPRDRGLRRPARAHRGGHDRRRRGAFRRRGPEDVRAQGRDDRDASLGGGNPGCGSPSTSARRLSRRVADRYARHRDHEPHLPRIPAPWKGDTATIGVLIQNHIFGEAVAYAMLEPRGSWPHDEDSGAGRSTMG